MLKIQYFVSIDGMGFENKTHRMAIIGYLLPEKEITRGFMKSPAGTA